jgi:hypothetical protein
MFLFRFSCFFASNLSQLRLKINRIMFHLTPTQNIFDKAIKHQLLLDWTTEFSQNGEANRLDPYMPVRAVHAGNENLMEYVNNSALTVGS